jgi:hypothetical protein
MVFMCSFQVLDAEETVNLQSWGAAYDELLQNVLSTDCISADDPRNTNDEVDPYNEIWDKGEKERLSVDVSTTTKCHHQCLIDLIH